MEDINNLLSQVNEYSTTKRIAVTRNEAVLLDYLLTAHSWDEALLERLQSHFVRGIRREAARVLTGHTDSVVLEENTISYLVALVPPIFPMGAEDVGLNLKRKLYLALYGEPPKPEPEQPEPEQAERSDDVGG